MSGLHVQAARVQIVCAANGGFVDFVSAGEESTKWPKVSRDGLDTVRAKIWSRSRASMSSKEGRMALRLHLAIEPRIKQLHYLAFYSDNCWNGLYNGSCRPSACPIAIFRSSNVDANKRLDCSQKVPFLKPPLPVN